MQFGNDVKYHTPKGNNTPRVITNPMNIFTIYNQIKVYNRNNPYI